MVLDIYVLRVIMKQWILTEPDATLIVTVHNRGLQHLICKLCKKLVNPNGLKTCRGLCHII